MNPSSSRKYLHGFDPAEQQRLRNQARFLEQIVYSGVDLSDVSQLLEPGAGVGAQSEILLRRYPEMFLTGVDLSEVQLAAARERLGGDPVTRGRHELHRMDATEMSFPSHRRFDGAFLCWVLEHVERPQKVLSEVRRVIAPGSPVYITEVLNSSFFLDPHSPHIRHYWTKFNELQIAIGGDPFVGAKLGNMLLAEGYSEINTETKTILLDNRYPDKRAAMIDFWTDALMSGMRSMLVAGYITEQEAELAREELGRVCMDPDAIFYYSFIQARAVT